MQEKDSVSDSFMLTQEVRKGFDSFGHIFHGTSLTHDGQELLPAAEHYGEVDNLSCHRCVFANFVQ